MSTEKKSRLETVSASHFCPLCGALSNDTICALDGGLTIALGGNDYSDAPLASDDVVDGRYRVLQVYGKGSFGYVFRAEHTRTGQAVALKVLHAERTQDQASERFIKEGRVLGRLRHSSTVQIFDVGTTVDGAPYIAMEFIEGPNLEQVIAHARDQGGALTEAQALDIVLPILGSLTEAHGLGLIHRDLKPANILLTQVADEPLVVKVVDFGVVRTQDSQLTSQRSSIGTPRYMSPEQCRGEVVDARSDLYSVGCILFEAVCGAPPFVSKSLVDTMFLQVGAPLPDVAALAKNPVTKDFVTALRRSLAKDAKDRFPTASAMRQALRKIRTTAWRNVPVTSTHAMMGVGLEPCLSATRRSEGVSNGDSFLVESRHATTAPVALPDTSAPMSGGAVSPRPAGRRASSSELVTDPRSARVATGASVATPRFSPRATRDNDRKSTPSAPQDYAHLSAPTPTPWDAAAMAVKTVDTPTEGKLPFDMSASQDVVALPSRRRVAAAIAAVEAKKKAAAMERSEAPTRIDVAVDLSDAVPQSRQVQVAPVGRQRRKSDWASGTLLGTGVPDEDLSE